MERRRPDEVSRATPATRRHFAPELFERLLDSMEDNPVTLVCAPGGSGKTTLLAQLCAGQRAVHRAVGVRSTRTTTHEPLLRRADAGGSPLELSWEIDPRALATNVAASKAHVRAALAALVNALCTTAAPRIVLVLDDLHRIEKSETFEVLDSLIERLPDHVAVVLGSRVEPPLSLARWRAYGELGEFTAEDLQFTVDEAPRSERSVSAEAPMPDRARSLARTHGWAAGLTLLLQSRRAWHRRCEGYRERAERHLFAYLAQEVLEDLPKDLQEFMLRCSILLELNPKMCTALTDRTDSRRVLESCIAATCS